MQASSMLFSHEDHYASVIEHWPALFDLEYIDLDLSSVYFNVRGPVEVLTDVGYSDIVRRKLTRLMKPPTQSRRRR